MSMFLLDLTLIDVSFVHYVSSMVAASAIYVSRGLLGVEDGEWNRALSHYTKYSEKDLDPCVRAMRKMLSKMKNSKFQVSGTLQSTYFIPTFDTTTKFIITIIYLA